MEKFTIETTEGILNVEEKYSAVGIWMREPGGDLDLWFDRWLEDDKGRRWKINGDPLLDLSYPIHTPDVVRSGGASPGCHIAKTNEIVLLGARGVIRNEAKIAVDFTPPLANGCGRETLWAMRVSPSMPTVSAALKLLKDKKLPEMDFFQIWNEAYFARGIHKMDLVVGTRNGDFLGGIPLYRAIMVVARGGNATVVAHWSKPPSAASNAIQEVMAKLKTWITPEHVRLPSTVSWDGYTNGQVCLLVATLPPQLVDAFKEHLRSVSLPPDRIEIPENQDTGFRPAGAN